MRVTEKDKNILQQDALVLKGLKFSHLRLITAIAETQQIKSAGAKLHIGQPSASRLLTELEQIVGHKLYARHPRGVILNESGILFAQKAQILLRGLDEVNRQINETGQGLRGVVNIGAVTGPSLEMILPLVQKARISHPNIEVSVAIDPSPVLAENLINGKLDFYVGRISDEMDPRPFRAKLIGKEPLELIVRSGHPLAKKLPTDLSSCIPFDWVLQAPGGLMRHAVEMYFVEHGYEMPKHILSTSSVMFTLGIIEQSNAIAPVPKSVADFYSKRNGMKITRLPVAKDLCVSDYSLICLNTNELSPASEAIYNILTDIISLG